MKLLVVLLLCCVALAQQVEFNSSYVCGEKGCDITNPAIYLGGFLPPYGNLDVLINNTNPNNTFILPPNAQLTLNSLSVWNTQLMLNGSLILQELEVTHVLLQISLELLVGEMQVEASTIYVSGYVSAQEFSCEHTTIYGSSTAALQIHEFDLEEGYIVFDANSSFVVYDETSFEDSTIRFDSQPIFGEVEFDNVEAYFPIGFLAENNFVISSSNFSAYFPDALANVSFTLAGQNNLDVSNLVFDSNKIKINNTGTPYITFRVSDNATFDGNLTVPGQVVVKAGSSVLFNGIVALTGGLLAQVDQFTTIQAIGSLITGLPIELHGDDSDLHHRSSFIVQNAVIVTPSLVLDRFVLHAYEGTTIIKGNVVNNGSIHIFNTSNVLIQGDYTQEPNSTLGAYNLSPSRSINLFVNGTANITGGELRYNTSETKKFTATILKADKELKGKFASELFLDTAGSNHTVKLSYTSHEVQVEITPTKHHGWMGEHWWMWLIIAAGAVVTLVIVFVLMRRRRSQYDRLPTRR